MCPVRTVTHVSGRSNNLHSVSRLPPLSLCRRFCDGENLKDKHGAAQRLQKRNLKALASEMSMLSTELGGLMSRPEIHKKQGFPFRYFVNDIQMASNADFCWSSGIRHSRLSRA